MSIATFQRYWAATWSWVGHVLGTLGRMQGAPEPTCGEGIVEYRDNPMMNYLPAVAIVFGNVINYRPLPSASGCLVRRYDDFERCAPLISLRDHELQHVLQYRRWGPAFIPAYLLAECLARFASVAGRRTVNYFERAADDACAPQPQNQSLES